MANISVKGDTSVHGGAPFDKGLSGNVYAGNLPVAESGVSGSNENDNQYDPLRRQIHNSGNQTANAGSATVFANGHPVHRVGDARLEGSTAGPGISSVQVG